MTRRAHMYWKSHVEFGKLLKEYIQIQASGEAFSQVQKATLRDKAKYGCRDLFANTLDNPKIQLETLENWHTKVESLKVKFTMTRVIEEAKKQLEREKEVAAHRQKSDKETADRVKSKKSTNVDDVQEGNDDD